MNLGTLVVLTALIVLVAAIIGSWIKAHRAGHHVGCDQCGRCSCGNPRATSPMRATTDSKTTSCRCAAAMVDHVTAASRTH